MKELHPIEVDECATALGLENKSAFAWWVSYNLKKRDRIVAAINTRVRKRAHKFGTNMSTNIKEALALDKENENNL